MKLRDRDEPLDPRAERELDALDDALAGRPVDPDLADWGELASLMRDERPEPEPSWASELDGRAARRFRPEGGGGSWRDLLERLRATPPRRIAGPVGALATLAVVALIGVSTLDEGGEAENLSSQPSGEGTRLNTTSLEPQSRNSAEVGGLAAPEASSAVEDKSRESSYRSSGASGDSAKLAAGTENRQVDRDVSMRLSAQPERVRDVSDEVITIARSLDGIVVNSQVTESGNRSAATLELTIPSDNLDTAIDRLSDLAHVDSLNETTVDITKPFVSAQDEVRDAQAERKSLLEALSNTTTETEAEALRLQIADARDRLSRAQARFENIARQARWSSVSVEVVADPNAPETDDGRTLGDWVDDALDVLRDVAGVLLVTAAVVVPLGILVAIVWLAVARIRGRRRERALDA